MKDVILHVVGSSRFGSVAIKMLWPCILEQIQNKVITICIALVACGIAYFFIFIIFFNFNFLV